MSTDNLTRLRECLVQLHLPAFSGALRRPGGTGYPGKSVLSPVFSCRYLRSKWRSGTSAKSSACAESRSFPGRKTLTALGPLALAPKRGIDN